jgi:hypothetical protein
MDASGRRISTQQIQAPNGNSQATVVLGTLPAGIYLMAVGEGDDQVVKRVVIQR